MIKAEWLKVLKTKKMLISIVAVLFIPVLYSGMFLWAFWDLANGIPEALVNKQYDAIVSTYALHHFTDEAKVAYIKALLPLLTPTGKIYIGDIAFETKAHLEKCRQESIGYWDDDEIYFVHEEFSKLLNQTCQIEFHPISHCGGVFIIK